MLVILIVVKVSRVYTYFKAFVILYANYMLFIVYQLSLNKVVFKIINF